MKNFIKLLNFEINRFMKLYLGMLALIFLSQLLTVIFLSINYMGLVKETTQGGRMSPEKYLEEYWPFSLADVFYSASFYGPILFGIVGLLFYVFFIWYRDWFSRQSFIYRLLMLPTSRMNIYLAKLMTILLTVLGMVASQLIFLRIYQQVIKWIVPVVYRADSDIVSLVRRNEYLNIIIPSYFEWFLIAYGLGLCFVMVLFTIILFERSFKWIGLFIGLIYGFLCFAIFAGPFLIQLLIYKDIYFYPFELLLIQTAITLLIAGISFWLSSYLIKHKITV